ncbi:MAG: hypothetical protein AAF546_00920 [Verrucomicrobiota bacterium]
MPQKRSTLDGKTMPVFILSGVIVVGILIFLVTRLGENGMGSLEPFPASSYLDRPIDYLGNTYAMRAQIDSQLLWEKNLGRVLAVRPDGERSRLPVFVPSEVGGNLHTGQRYEMRVRIDEGGLIYVEELRKY